MSIKADPLPRVPLSFLETHKRFTNISSNAKRVRSGFSSIPLALIPGTQIKANTVKLNCKKYQVLSTNVSSVINLVFITIFNVNVVILSYHVDPELYHNTFVILHFSAIK